MNNIPERDPGVQGPNPWRPATVQNFVRIRNSGLPERYHRGTDDQLFYEHYLRAVPYLRILEKAPEVLIVGSEEVPSLKAQLSKLQESNQISKQALRAVQREITETRKELESEKNRNRR